MTPHREKSARFIIVDGGTIHDSTPPKKRKRVDGTSGLHSDGEDGPVSVPMEDPNLVNDEFYHLEHGDCFVRVEDTLFKVHSEVLVMSPLLAEKLASLRTPPSRANPLKLRGIADEFRALMWARYASVDDVQDQPRTPTDLLRLLHLATITRGYSFAELHAWTIKAIYNAFTADPPRLPTCSSELFQKLVEVAKECKALDLLDAVLAKWTEAVKRKEVSPLPAINIADTYGLRGLRGIAYYTYLQARLSEAKEANDEESVKSGSGGDGMAAVPYRLDLDEKLSPSQRIALLAGQLSLSKFWERRRRMPLPLARPPAPLDGGATPHDHDKCIETWLARWRNAAWTERVLDMQSSDVLGILGVMCNIMEEDREVNREVDEECRVLALDTVRQELCELRLALPEHFAYSSA